MACRNDTHHGGRTIKCKGIELAALKTRRTKTGRVFHGFDALRHALINYGSGHMGDLGWHSLPVTAHVHPSAILGDNHFHLLGIHVKARWQNHIDFILHGLAGRNHRHGNMIRASIFVGRHKASNIGLAIGISRSGRSKQYRCEREC